MQIAWNERQLESQRAEEGQGQGDWGEQWRGRNPGKASEVFKGRQNPHCLFQRFQIASHRLPRTPQRSAFKQLSWQQPVFCGKGPRGKAFTYPSSKDR